MQRGTAIALLLGAGLFPAAAGGAVPFPTRQGEVGLLDVPSADVSEVGGGLMGGELRFDRTPGQPNAIGPLPLSLVFGLLNRVDGGFSMREGGFPGDRRSSTGLLFGSALKLQAFPASGSFPGAALSLTADRMNDLAVFGARLAASTADLGRIRFAAFAGAEGTAFSDLGATAGLAAAVIHRSDLETVVEAVYGPQGSLFAGAFRWAFTPKVGVSLGLSYLPRDSSLRVSLGFSMAAASTRRKKPGAVEAPKPVVEAKAAPKGPTFLDDRPRFRMRIASVTPGDPGPRRLQHGPFGDPGRHSPTARPQALEPADPQQVRARDLESAGETLDARERRLRSAEAALAARDERLAAERSRLEKRRADLEGMTERLDGRERQVKAAGKPGEREVALAETEEKLRQSEAEQAAAAALARAEAERGAAREREQQQREQQARAQARGAPAKAGLEAQEAAQASRRDLLSAYEDRLSATRARLEAVEKGLELQGLELDARERRLSAKEDRLLAMERRARARGAEVAAAPRAAPGPAAPLAMVLKAPSSILRGTGAAAVVPGAVAKAVSAATVVALATPDQPLAATDKDAVESTARLAAQEKSELLIWARAQNPGLMEAAARRAEELKALAVAAGMPAAGVTTRVTLRPSSNGIDVVVSAIREGAAAAPTDRGPALAEGETGKRQLRDALAQVRPDIERCFQAAMSARRLDRAEVVLQLAVDASGKVESIAATGTLGGGEVDRCLSDAASGWRLPSAPGGYSTEIPTSVVGTGGGR